MFGLPKTTELSKQLPKKAIFQKFKTSTKDRNLFDEQIHRLSIVSEISPQTVSIPAHDEVAAIYIVLVIMKTDECHDKNIQLLSKLIDQHMLFALQYEDKVQFATYRAGQVLKSEKKSLHDWELSLDGLHLQYTWDYLIADIYGLQWEEERSLDHTIVAAVESEKLKERISRLQKKAMSERQPRRKWELVQEIKKLEEELEGVQS